MANESPKPFIPFLKRKKQPQPPPQQLNNDTAIVAFDQNSIHNNNINNINNINTTTTDTSSPIANSINGTSNNTTLSSSSSTSSSNIINSSSSTPEQSSHLSPTVINNTLEDLQQTKDQVPLVKEPQDQIQQQSQEQATKQIGNNNGININNITEMADKEIINNNHHINNINGNSNIQNNIYINNNVNKNNIESYDINNNQIINKENHSNINSIDISDKINNSDIVMNEIDYNDISNGSNNIQTRDSTLSSTIDQEDKMVIDEQIISSLPINNGNNNNDSNKVQQENNIEENENKSSSKLLKLLNKKSMASTSTPFFDKELFKAKLQIVNPELFTEEEILDINSNSIVSEIYTQPKEEKDQDEEDQDNDEREITSNKKQIKNKRVNNKRVNKQSQQQQHQNKHHQHKQHQHKHHHNLELLNSLEDEKNYTQRYRYLKKNEEELNKPVYREIEDDFPTAPFNKPIGYVIYQDKSNEELNDEVEYDMESEDELWLKEFNKSTSSHYNEDDFEFIIDRLEKETFKYKQEIGSDKFLHFSSVEADDVCAVCFDGTSDDTNQIVYCDGCDIAVHQDCYGIILIPEGHWFCQKCESPDKNQITCLLCGKKNGGFKQTIDGDWVHLVCVYNIPELIPIIKKGGGRDKLGPSGLLNHILKQRYKLKCSVCRKKVGACIQCRERNCSIAFHPFCIKTKQKAFRKDIEHDEDDETQLNPHVVFCTKHFEKKVLNHQSINEKLGSDMPFDESKEENNSSTILFDSASDNSSDTSSDYGDDDSYNSDSDFGSNVNKNNRRNNRNSGKISTPKKKNTPSKSGRMTPKKTPSKSNRQQEENEGNNSDLENNSKNQSKKKSTTTPTTTTSSTNTGITAKKAGLISISRATKKIKSYPSIFVHGVYNYWVKKRISRSGLALIKRLQPSFIYSTRSTRKEDGINTVSDYNQLLAIRKDLERCRTILELVRKRERQKRELAISNRDIIEAIMFNDYYFLRVVLRTLESIEVLRPFFMPVSEEEAPSYFTIIKQPMSFHQMKLQLNNYQYESNEEFFKDLTLIYTNAQLFNRPKTSVYKASKILQDITNKLEYELPDSITPNELDSFIKSIVKPIATPFQKKSNNSISTNNNIKNDQYDNNSSNSTETTNDDDGDNSNSSISSNKIIPLIKPKLPIEEFKKSLNKPQPQPTESPQRPPTRSTLTNVVLQCESFTGLPIPPKRFKKRKETENGKVSTDDNQNKKYKIESTPSPIKTRSRDLSSNEALKRVPNYSKEVEEEVKEEVEEEVEEEEEKEEPSSKETLIEKVQDFNHSSRGRTIKPIPFYVSSSPEPKKKKEEQSNLTTSTKTNSINSTNSVDPNLIDNYQLEFKESIVNKIKKEIRDLKFHSKLSEMVSNSNIYLTNDLQKLMLEIVNKLSNDVKGTHMEKRNREVIGKEAITYLEHIDYRIYRDQYLWGAFEIWVDLKKVAARTKIQEIKGILNKQIDIYQKLYAKELLETQKLVQTQQYENAIEKEKNNK